MTKTAAISALILNEVAKGLPLNEAFNAVLGQGAYEKLASDVYDALKSRGQ